MKRRLIAALTVLMAVGPFTVPSASAEDLANHWAKDKMGYLIENEILTGYGDGNYRPDNTITRAEFATMLVKVLELPEVGTVATFHDVKQGDWYYDSVNRASYYELIAGDDKGNFNPNAKITRQEMAVMLNNAMKYDGVTVSPATLSFKDNNKIASWAFDDVQTVVSFKLINGYPDSTFKPLGSTTRAEASTVLYFYLKPEEKTVDEPVEEPVEIGKEINKVSYNRNFSDVVTLQANHSPNVDGSGKFLATPEVVSYYLNSNNFAENSPEFYQFLKLSTPVTGLDATKINEKILFDKVILKGTANSFIEAGLTSQINAIYLIAHALHETNNGKSKLASGIEVGLNAEGKPEMVTNENRTILTDIKVTYNFYGVNAFNTNPDKFGAEKAYTEKWFTVHDAIVGGAKFVREKYIDEGQDTLYKMKWDPDQPTNHQYATHIMWANIQARKIHEFYALTESDKTTKLVFEVPQYANQPATSPLPAPEAQYALLPALPGVVGKINSTDGDVRIRSYPEAGTILTQLSHGTEISVVGHNGNWYRVTANGTEGWVSGDYIQLTNGLKVIDMSRLSVKTLNVRSEPNTYSSIIDNIEQKTVFPGLVDANGNFVRDGLWYQLNLNGQSGWVRGDYVLELTKKSETK